MRKSLHHPYFRCPTYRCLPQLPAGDGPSEPDTDMLASVLSTAFLAKNLTFVCSQQDRWLAAGHQN